MEDYTSFDEVISYRGGRQRVTEQSFNVTITQDNIEEPAEDFFLNLVAIENLIVLTPVITIRIVGTDAGIIYKQQHFCMCISVESVSICMVYILCHNFYL